MSHTSCIPGLLWAARKALMGGNLYTSATRPRPLRGFELPWHGRERRTEPTSVLVEDGEGALGPAIVMDR